MINAVEDPRKTPWALRPLFDEVNDLLCCFSRLQLGFVPRTANAVADWAAKAQLGGTLSSSWLAFPPPLLLDLLISDVMDAASR